MPSRRMIDPGLWQSYTMAKLTRNQRLLFIGLFSNADDQGRLKGHPLFIRSVVFPFDDIALDEIERDLAAIEAIGSIQPYKMDGEIYIQLVGWWDYQAPQWAYPSRIVAPPGWADRLRYRKGGEVHHVQWDGQGGFVAIAQDDSQEPSDALPNALGKDLGKDLPEPIVQYSNSIEQSSDSIEDTGADAPSSPPEEPKDTPPKKPKPQRKRSKLDVIKLALEVHFANVTKLARPPTGNEKQRKSAGQLWWGPLTKLVKACDDDVESAKRLIDWSVGELDKNGFTVSSPQSILKTATAEQARRQRDGTSGNNSGAYGKGHFATGMGDPITAADFADE